MKKKLMICFLFFAVLSACSSNKGSVSNINASKAIDKVNSGDTFVLVVGTTNCTYCIEFDETLNDFIKENEITVYTLKIDKESTETVDGKEVRVKFLELEDLIGKTIRTPTTFFIVDGKTVSSHEGAYSYEAFEKALKKYEFLK